MEAKHMVMSALGLGLGVGVGLGLAGGQTVGRWAAAAQAAGVTVEKIAEELMRMVVDGRESKVTFDEFPYYLRKSHGTATRSVSRLAYAEDILEVLEISWDCNCNSDCEQTRVVLTSAAFVHLKQADFSKYTRNLSPASRAILLSGPTELYQQMLAKALAHYFEAKLLLLDVQSKYGIANKDSVFKRSVSESTLERVTSILGSFSILYQKEEPKGSLRRQSSGVDLRSRGQEAKGGMSKLRRNASASSDISTLSSETTLINQAPASLKCTGSWPFDDKLLIQALYKVLVSVSKSNPIVLYLRDVEGLLFRSQTIYSMFLKMLKKLSGPVLILGSKIVELDSNVRGVDESISTLFPYSIEIKPPQDENHLDGANEENDATKKPETKSEAPACDNKSEPEKLGTVAKNESGVLPPKAPESPPDNEFEKRIRPEVIPASEIGITFDDIGALDDIKESLQELVMLPLRRPDLFKGGLLKPCRGILLFGPPGTGKTMLAKAIANEAGASFINVSMSTITSKWFGEDEKNVRAVFTLAAKVSPTIIFVDEVDSMLGQRTRVGEHEAMRKIKNEFMTHWDGLLTKPGERILVLAATNRPFDLDEAIIRRFERRIMVGLPSMESRELILKSLLSKEKVEGLDYKDLATMTEGYSGSDLKNLCTTAAYRPLRELIQQERQRDTKRKQRVEEAKKSTEASENSEHNDEAPIILRPLTMADMRQAKNQVAPSFASEGSVMNELKQWNDLYGEGGSRKKQQLTYFL
ncbi:Katanin p60 ATPase-containing subunit A1 [Apostasia shenzhenica]|uniref:Katanin p60 ATPase-containing subunit A1 n=1 Tax=Apostasia shenzhenica TaxID=1088818 RepID=A0A2I0B6G7_9ASPA|nr:Katanin p60 ATPase-containing subunit A1 [Apostasia shenzhenica]